LCKTKGATQTKECKKEPFFHAYFSCLAIYKNLLEPMTALGIN